MKSRLLAVFLVVALALTLFPAAAQDMMDPCLGLSAADCEIVKAADAKVAELTSFTQSFKFNLSLSGLQTLSGLMGTTGEGAPQALTITADAANSPFVLNLAASDPMAAFAMAMDVNGSITGTGSDDQSGTSSFVIVDGVFYAKDPETGQWMGIPLSEFLDSAGMAGLPVDPAALLEGDMGAMGAAADPTALLAGSGLSPEDVAALMTVEGFTSQTRLADAEMMGQAMYAFESKIDFVPLLSSQAFQNILTNLAASSDDPSMAQAGQIGMMLPMLLQEGNIKLTRWIGANDMWIHRVVVEANVVVDLAAMMGASGGSNAPQMEPITLRMMLDVELSAHNATVAPTAPEGAQMMEMGS
ncbi:MAG: hypothetical protein HXY41_07140 [Chloroflexi bacterium]|nr:hypothetical protein [Chloroflexota bacterium]